MASTSNKKANDNQISHYVLNELLVEQASSAIYLAQNSKNDEPVFLVTLQPDATKSNDLAERFQRRAETISQLTHDALLPLVDFGLDGKRPYAIMPHRSGQFLAEKLAATPPRSEDDTDKSKIIASLQLVKQIAAGLTVAHPSGLIHHNLRPENIFLDEAGHPYLLDLVVPATLPVVSHIEAVQVTELDYQSPEQLSGKALSGRSNIYSLGVLLYRLLAGHKPALPVSEWDIFDQKGITREIPLDKVRSDLTTATYTAVRDSIWQKEWSRYETVDAQIRAFDRAIKAESAPPPPPPPAWRRLLIWLRQPKTLKIVIPAVGLLFLLLLALMFMRGRANRQQNVPATPNGASLPLETEPAASLDSDVTTPDFTMEASDKAPKTGEDVVLLLTKEVETAVPLPPTETSSPIDINQS